MKEKISVVVPVFNEEENVAKLHQEIVDLAVKENYDAEIIFVDDGSTDKTFKKLKKLSPVKIVKLRKNFGQTAAFDAGIKESSGDIIITMDGDGQNDPKGIPTLLKKLEKGYDVVVGWRKMRHDDPLKKSISKGAFWLRKTILGDKVHDSGCSLKVFKSTCFKDINLLGEEHRLIPAILAWHGFKISEAPVPHRPRTKGVTKYGWKRMVKGFLDVLGVWFWRKYSARPLHLFGAAGLFFTFLGTAGAIVLFVLRLLEIIYLQNRIWPLVALFLILAGVQLFVTGLLADIMIKNYYKESKSPSYSVEEIISK